MRAAIIGASGYVGAELIRLLATHPSIEIGPLVADRRAGDPLAAVFPHLRHLGLPDLVRLEQADLDVDLVVCALPHGTSTDIVAGLPGHLRIVDTSADFRLKDPAVYAAWYGPHRAPHLLAQAAYGLPEHHRDAIRTARIVAATGCNAATANLALIPLVRAGAVGDDIVISLATGVSGAGRKAAEGLLHSEVSEGFHAYNVARHRHTAEFDQELSAAAGREVRVSFTAHLLPQNRGILASIYVHGDAERIHATLAAAYAAEPFVHVLPLGEVPATRHVRGSNFCHIGVAADRVPGRAIVFSALDNLVKGAAGMAVQCANIMLGLPETQGLEAAPLFP